MMRIVHQVNGGNKSSQMILPVEKRVCPPGIEERGPGSFRNMTWLYIPCMLAGGDSTVRREEMDWGPDTGVQEAFLLLSFNSARSIPGIEE